MKWLILILLLSFSQTPDGYLWLSTAKGLARFDGLKFPVIPLIIKPGDSRPLRVPTVCKTKEFAAKLAHLMEKETVSTTPHILSQVLNEKLNRGFPDFINSYRVEEARKIFASPRGAEKKNSTVAGDVGFNA